MRSEANRKEQIIRAARLLFSRKRYDRVLMDEIAKMAGCAKGTMYLYFKTKEELYLELLLQDSAHLQQIVRHISSEVKEPWEAIKKIISAVLKFLERHQAFFILWHQADLHLYDKKQRTYLHQQHLNMVNIISKVIAKGIKEKKIQKGNPHFYAKTLLGMLFFAVTPETKLTPKTTSLFFDLFAYGLKNEGEKSGLRRLSAT